MGWRPGPMDLTTCSASTAFIASIPFVLCCRFNAGGLPPHLFPRLRRPDAEHCLPQSSKPAPPPTEVRFVAGNPINAPSYSTWRTVPRAFTIAKAREVRALTLFPTFALLEPY